MRACVRACVCVHVCLLMCMVRERGQKEKPGKDGVCGGWGEKGHRGLGVSSPQRVNNARGLAEVGHTPDKAPLTRRRVVEGGRRVQCATPLRGSRESRDFTKES